jgi:ATP-dependent DNA helicase RecQ
VKRRPLGEFRFEELADEFIQLAGDQGSVLNVTKFLCGVSSPMLMKLNAKKLPRFAVLEKHPFLEVRKWVGDCLKTRS